MLCFQLRRRRGTQAIHTCTELESSMACGKPWVWVEFGFFNSFMVCRVGFGLVGGTILHSAGLFVQEHQVELPAQPPLVFPDVSG